MTGGVCDGGRQSGDYSGSGGHLSPQHGPMSVMNPTIMPSHGCPQLLQICMPHDVHEAGFCGSGFFGDRRRVRREGGVIYR